MHTLEDDVGFLLYRTAQAMRARLMLSLTAEGITFEQYQVLVALSLGDNIPQNVLADRMRLEKSVLARVLRRLQNDGLFVRISAPHDLRVKRVLLTARGRTLQTRVLELREGHLQEVLACLGGEEVNELKRLLNRLFDHNLQALAEAKGRQRASVRCSQTHV